MHYDIWRVAAGVFVLLSATIVLEAQVAITESPVLVLRAPNHNRSVCFSPDSKRLLTVREHFSEKKVCIFSIPDGRLEREFGEGNSNITSAAFSPDGRFIVYGSEDGRVRVADATTGIQVSELKMEGSVKAVAWSPDGRSVVAGGGGKKIRVWDAAANFSPRFEGPPHKELITGVAVSPDGRFAASCGEDKCINVVDLQRGTPVTTLEPRGDESKFSSIAFSGDGRFMCTGEEEKRFRVWRVPDFVPLGQFPRENDNDILAVALSADGKLGASGGRDYKVVIWEIEGCRMLCKREARADVESLAFSADGKFLAVGTSNKGVLLFGLTGTGAGVRPSVATSPHVPASGIIVTAKPQSTLHPVAGKKEALAVVDFELRGRLRTSEPDAGRTIASLLLSRLDSTRYEIYERGQLLQLLNEQKLQMSDVADNADQAIKFGKLKGIRFIVLGSVDQLGETFYITARLVDCETGRVGLKADAMTNDLNLLGPAIDQLLAKMGLGG